MVELKVRRFGNALGVVLPKEVISRLGAKEGAPLYLIETPDGGYRLVPIRPLEVFDAFPECGSSGHEFLAVIFIAGDFLDDGFIGAHDDREEALDGIGTHHLPVHLWLIALDDLLQRFTTADMFAFDRALI